MRLDYEPGSDRAPQRRAFGLMPVALVLGTCAMAVLAYGMIFLQDEIVGSVVDSHYHAWLYTAPLAGGMSFTGTALSALMIFRRSLPLRYAMIGLVWNALPAAVFLLSLLDRRF